MTDDPRVLVAYKKSRWEHYVEGGEGDADATQTSDSGTSIEELKRAHHVHRGGLDAVVEHLEARGLNFDASYRGEIDDPSDYDLVVTVGGDGTVLDVSHRVEDVPVLAINSHPDSSVGYFCAGVADRFPSLLEDAVAGELPAYDLLRFQLEIDGTATGPPILNDVLLSHANPAAVSRYLLDLDTEEAEKQASSGIWISTPAGSTAAIRSAGGYVLPLGCRCIQYLVREPYPIPDRPYRHRKGIRPASAPFRVHSRMQEGRVFVDGPHIQFDFGFGSTVRLDDDAPNLRLFGLHTSRRTSDG